MFRRRVVIEASEEGAQNLLGQWHDGSADMVEVRGTAFQDPVFTVPLRVAPPGPGLRTVIVVGGPRSEPGSLGDHFKAVKELTGPVRIVSVEKIED